MGKCRCCDKRLDGAITGVCIEIARPLLPTSICLDIHRRRGNRPRLHLLDSFQQPQSMTQTTQLEKNDQEEGRDGGGN
ncbi:hypothetical protein PILCRDRAFT_819664 [Piloderma croceum F 1598]|uniref:Uncharacterized protein n=1 Tax=Piloderma croceum (strain F 1598) TaxID=765440 RepID=A0A0C3FVC6_PILCF|nr:hypothetical protein PILCRDRAFT_819664 [Piloderma croceum F 1598]